MISKPILLLVMALAIMLLLLALLIGREKTMLKQSIAVRGDKVKSLTDTVRRLSNVVKIKEKKLDSLRSYVANIKTAKPDPSFSHKAASKAYPQKVIAIPDRPPLPCTCDPGKQPSIKSGKYSVYPNTFLVQPKLSCHPQATNVVIDLMIDGARLTNANIRMSLYQSSSFVESPCVKVDSGENNFKVESYAIHCDASVFGASAVEKLPVPKLLLTITPEKKIGYDVKLVVNIDCDVTMCSIELYSKGVLVRTTAFPMTYTDKD